MTTFVLRRLLQTLPMLLGVAAVTFLLLHLAPGDYLGDLAMNPAVSPETLAGLRHLRFRGHEVVLFHVLHPDEVTFPLDGNIRFIGLEGFEELMTRPHLLKPAYLRIVKKYLEDIRRGCDGSGVDYVPLSTERPLSNALAEYLVRRLQAARR